MKIDHYTYSGYAEIIDTKLLNSWPKFIHHYVVVNNVSFNLYSHEILNVKASWSDPEFLEYLLIEPQQH